MNSFDKVIYTISFVYGIVLGLVMPLLVPKEGYEKFEEIGILNSPFVTTLAVILATGASGGTIWIMVRIARHQPMVVLLLIKLFVFALPAVAAGYVASMALGWLGFYETPLNFFAFLVISAILYFCAGIIGIATINSTPEYKQLLHAWNKDRGAKLR